MVFVCHMHQFGGCVFIADFVTDSVAGFVLLCEFVIDSVRASVHCRPDSGFMQLSQVAWQHV